MKFGNIYVNQADISFASKVDVIVTFRGPALPPPSNDWIVGTSSFSRLISDGLSRIWPTDPQVVNLPVPALKLDLKNGKTKTIIPFPVKYNNGYEHIFDTTNNKPIKEYAQKYINKYRKQVNSWLSQLE